MILISGTSVARVLFVIVACGIGIDVPTVERVIHIGVPYTMENFFQEIGRAGRNGNIAMSVLYYNSYDISYAEICNNTVLWARGNSSPFWCFTASTNMWSQLL